MYFIIVCIILFIKKQSLTIKLLNRCLLLVLLKFFYLIDTISEIRKCRYENI